MCSSDLLCFGLIRLAHEPPDLAIWVAKAGKGAKRFGVGQGQSGTSDHLRLLGIGLATCRLGPVKAEFGVGAVAIGLLRAAAQRQRA